jgi:hypothetical protein
VDVTQVAQCLFLLPGFLDGGDRSVVLSNQPSSPAGISDVALRTDSPEMAASPTILPPSPLTTGGLSSTLMITNLPTLLFSQSTDLQPLLCPFGDIKRLDILQATAVDIQAGKLAVVVEYASATSAKEAMTGLSGQVYAGFFVEAKFIDNVPEPVQPNANTMSRLSPTASAFAFSVTPSSPEKHRAPSRGFFGRDVANNPSFGRLPPPIDTSHASWPFPARPVSASATTYFDEDLYVYGCKASAVG